MSIETKYRRDIQALRGLAVLAVVLFHAKKDYFPLGYLGVDVFFVISGLVITPLLLGIFQRKEFSTGLKTFYTRRFYRLAPALGSTLGLSTLLIFFFGDLKDLGRFAAQGIASLLIIGNLGVLKFSGDYFSPDPNPLIHTWSLSIEEQIYLFLPLVMLLVSWKNRTRLRSNWTKLFTFLFALSFLLFLTPHFLSKLGIEFALIGNSDFIFYFSFSRLWEFLAGSLIYVANQTYFSHVARWTKIIKQSALLSILVTLLSPISLSNVIITPIAVLLTVIYLLFGEPSENSRALGFFNWAGDRSYSIYLVHMPLLYLAKYTPGLGNGPFQKFLVVMMIMMSVLLGHLQFELIEKKFRISGLRDTLVPTRSIVWSAIGFIGIPMALFGLILASVQMDFKPIVKNFVEDQKVDPHLLVRAGCVDTEFNPFRCSWNVTPNVGSVLLVGDSQAYAAADGVQLAAKKLQLNFLGVSASGCPFLQTDTTGDKPINCLKFQESILKYIQTSKPTFVIIANRASGYLESSGEWQTFLNSEGKPVKDISEASKIYYKQLYELATILKALETKVIIFQDVPEPSQVGNPQSIFQYTFLQNRYKPGSTTMLKLSKASRKIEESLARTGLISLYDPSVEICGNSCSEKISIRHMYMDAWHLSKKGSLNLSNSIENLIKANL